MPIGKGNHPGTGGTTFSSSVLKNIPTTSKSGSVKDIPNASAPPRRIKPPAPAITPTKGGESDSSYMSRALKSYQKQSTPTGKAAEKYDTSTRGRKPRYD
jgi:hypothetical protein